MFYYKTFLIQTIVSVIHGAKLRPLIPLTYILSLNAMNRESILTYHILSYIEKDKTISQRKLSTRIGLNISSINFALRKLVSKGYVRMHGINPRRITYHLTPKGISEKTQLAYKFFIKNYHLFQDVQNDIIVKIDKIDKSNGNRIAIYGISPFLEITYTILVEHGFKIIGIFDEKTAVRGWQNIKYDIKEIGEMKTSDIDYIIELKDLRETLEDINNENRMPLELIKRVKLF